MNTLCRYFDGYDQPKWLVEIDVEFKSEISYYGWLVETDLVPDFRSALLQNLQSLETLFICCGLSNRDNEIDVKHIITKSQHSQPGIKITTMEVLACRYRLHRIFKPINIASLNFLKIIHQRHKSTTIQVLKTDKIIWFIWIVLENGQCF